MDFAALLDAFLHVSMEMSPYLLLGFLLAGLLSVILPTAWVRRHLSGDGVGPVFKASLLGVPLPLCSCGVIPVSAALREQGANRAATVSFLVSTPQTGVDSILVTASLLGWAFALYRTFLAFLCGIFAGMFATWWKDPEESKTGADEPAEQSLGQLGSVSMLDRTPTAAPSASPCCRGSQVTVAIPSVPMAARGCKEPVKAGASCCNGPSTASEHTTSTTAGVLRRALNYGLLKLPTELAGPLLIGLLVSALISAAVPDQFFHGTGGLVGMLVVMLASVPMYVCATASVPLAWALLQKDASVGMVLVFLMTGPATNSATIAALWRILGWRTTLIYVGTICLTALAGGLFLEQLFAATELTAEPLQHALLPLWLRGGSAIALFALLAVGLWRRYGPGKRAIA